MKYDTSELCDIYQEDVNVVEPLFSNFGGRSSFGGQIITVKCFEDNGLLYDMLEQNGRGHVLLVDGGGSVRRALIDADLARLAVQNEWEGLVVYGAVRQVDDLEDLDIGIQALAAIPVGAAGEGTAYDFTKGANLYEAIQQNEKGGFDDAFVVNGPGKAVEPIAVLRDTQSGNTVTIDSDRNSLIMYTMNDDLPDVHFKRDNGRPAKKQEGVALEAQTLPDAINQETFGDIVLPRGAKRSYHIKYTYSNDKN